MKKCQAFSLIELSLTLLVLGIIGMYALPALKQMQQTYKRAYIKKNQELILKSLAFYADIHHCLPTASLPHQGGVTVPDLDHGIVPYKTLNLDEKVVKDSKGTWINYIVNRALTTVCNHQKKVLGKETLRTVDLSASRFKVDDYDNSKIDGLAFALISSLNSGESTQKENDEQQFQSHIITTKPNDIIFWISRNNFIAQYMKNPPLIDIPLHEGPQESSSMGTQNLTMNQEWNLFD